MRKFSNNNNKKKYNILQYSKTVGYFSRTALQVLRMICGKILEVIGTLHILLLT